MRAVLAVPMFFAFLGAMVLFFLFGLRRLFSLDGASGPWGGAAAEGLARAAEALGASGGGDLTKDGAFLLSLEGRSLHVFGAWPDKRGNAVVGLGLDVVASNVAVAAGSPFRGASGRRVLARLPHIVLRRETEFEGFGKRFGLSLEVQTGDARFDGLVYVDSRAPRDDVAAVLADERVRRGALGLFGAGCTSVTFAEGPHPVAALWFSHVQTTMSPDTLQACSRHLLDIADGLPPFQQVAAERGFRIYWLEIAYFSLGLAAMIFGTDSIARWPLLGWGMIPLAAGLAALSMVALLALGVVVLRGHSDSLLRLCVAAVGASMLGPGLAVAGLTFANGWRDATEVERPTTIISSHRAVLKKNSTYHLSVAPLHPGAPPRDLTVSREQFERAQSPQHRRVIVRTGAGRLGFEWLRSVEVL